MWGASAIELLAPAIAARGPHPQTPADVAVEFDAMVIELLLRESGLLHPLAGGAGGRTALMGELFLQQLARELAVQVNLGFGDLLAQQAALTSEGGAT